MRPAAALAILALAGVPAAACQYCMGQQQYDGATDAPPPAHVPAVITKAPKLDEADLAFILALGEGKRYAKVGDYVADKRVFDPWTRLLDAAALIELLRPRGAEIVAELRKKAAARKLAAADYQLAAHFYSDLPAATTLEDWEFLSLLVSPPKKEKVSNPKT